MSKEAATALKNKFASNVSFSGYFRTVTVKEEGEYKEFDVECTEWKTQGTSGTSGSTHTKKETYWEHKGYSATINGKEEGSYSYSDFYSYYNHPSYGEHHPFPDSDSEYDKKNGWSIHHALTGVIERSDNYVKGSQIRWSSYERFNVFKDERETAPAREFCGRPNWDCYTREYYDPTSGRVIPSENLYKEPVIERKVRVYFADPNESVKDNILSEADYVVRPPAKTLLQRIFGK